MLQYFPSESECASVFSAEAPQTDWIVRASMLRNSCRGRSCNNLFVTITINTIITALIHILNDINDSFDDTKNN